MQIQKSCTDTGGMCVYMRVCHGIELSNMLHTTNTNKFMLGTRPIYTQTYKCKTGCKCEYPLEKIPIRHKKKTIKGRRYLKHIHTNNNN